MKPRQTADFHKRLHRWYAACGRKTLPWRNTTDPYAIYVSEVMLQQTQVKTVLERYYFQFLARFPTVSALAGAPRQDVLQAWQGLGYYSRASNLHEAAKQLEGLGFRDWGLEKNTLIPNAQSLIPTLVKLPGIGRNTAHAVAAFGFHQPVPVMEANVKRVLSRIFALKHPTAADLWERAEQLLDRRKPFDYNQAMMDIGAMVCRKRAPACGECPANAVCEGKGHPESYPAAAKKKTVPVRRKRILVLRDSRGKIFASPRTGRFLHGLYHFVESDSEKLVAENRNYRWAEGKPLGHVTQSYSHFTLEAEVRLLQLPRVQNGSGWHGKNTLATLPFSNAEHKILRLLPVD